MPTLVEIQAQLRTLPVVIAQELAQDSAKTNEYLWLTRLIEHLLPWSGELGLRFEHFQRTVSVADARSVKPAQMARNLGSLQRLLEQLARNPLLSDTERQTRMTLAEVLGQLEQCFSRGEVLPMPQPSPPPNKPPRSAHDTGMISLLYGLETLKTTPPPVAPPPEPLVEPVVEPLPEPRRPSAQEKMLQAMARALRQRQQPPEKPD